MTTISLPSQLSPNQTKPIEQTPPQSPSNAPEESCFPHNTVLWGALDGFPTWPARVVKKSEIDFDGLKISSIPPNTALIMFFNDGNRFNVLDDGKLELFYPDTVDEVLGRIRKKTVKSIRLAAEYAVEHIKRFKPYLNILPPSERKQAIAELRQKRSQTSDDGDFKRSNSRSNIERKGPVPGSGSGGGGGRGRRKSQLPDRRGGIHESDGESRGGGGGKGRGLKRLDSEGRADNEGVPKTIKRRGPGRPPRSSYDGVVKGRGGKKNARRNSTSSQLPPSKKRRRSASPLSSSSIDESRARPLPKAMLPSMKGGDHVGGEDVLNQRRSHDAFSLGVDDGSHIRRRTDRQGPAHELDPAVVHAGGKRGRGRPSERDRERERDIRPLSEDDDSQSPHSIQSGDERGRKGVSSGRIGGLKSPHEVPVGVDVVSERRKRSPDRENGNDDGDETDSSSGRSDANTRRAVNDIEISDVDDEGRAGAGGSTRKPRMASGGDDDGEDTVDDADGYVTNSNVRRVDNRMSSVREPIIDDDLKDRVIRDLDGDDDGDKQDVESIGDDKEGEGSSRSVGTSPVRRVEVAKWDDGSGEVFYEGNDCVPDEKFISPYFQLDKKDLIVLLERRDRELSRSLLMVWKQGALLRKDSVVHDARKVSKECANVFDLTDSLQAAADKHRTGCIESKPHSTLANGDDGRINSVANCEHCKATFSLMEDLACSMAHKLSEIFFSPDVDIRPVIHRLLSVVEKVWPTSKRAALAVRNVASLWADVYAFFLEDKRDDNGDRKGIVRDGESDDKIDSESGSDREGNDDRGRRQKQEGDTERDADGNENTQRLHDGIDGFGSPDGSAPTPSPPNDSDDQPESERMRGDIVESFDSDAESGPNEQEGLQQQIDEADDMDDNVLKSVMEDEANDDDGDGSHKRGLEEVEVEMANEKVGTGANEVDGKSTARDVGVESRRRGFENESAKRRHANTDKKASVNDYNDNDISGGDDRTERRGERNREDVGRARRRIEQQRGRGNGSFGESSESGSESDRGGIGRSDGRQRELRGDGRGGGDASLAGAGNRNSDAYRRPDPNAARGNGIFQRDGERGRGGLSEPANGFVEDHRTSGDGKGSSAAVQRHERDHRQQHPVWNGESEHRIAKKENMPENRNGVDYESGRQADVPIRNGGGGGEKGENDYKNHHRANGSLNEVPEKKRDRSDGGSGGEKLPKERREILKELKSVFDLLDGQMGKKMRKEMVSVLEEACWTYSNASSQKYQQVSVSLRRLIQNYARDGQNRAAGDRPVSDDLIATAVQGIANDGGHRQKHALCLVQLCMEDGDEAT